MGQYQQWLRYQDIEQSLRKTRRALEEELAQLESQLDTVFFEQLAQHEYPLNSNPILSALLTSLQSPKRYTSEQASLPLNTPLASTQREASQPGDEAMLANVDFLDQLQMVFATLLPEEVEQFYSVYRQWLLQKRIVDVRQRLTALQEQLGANELRTRHYRPSPIALASLARLQANGVNDIELLDQMLERGEAWLDATMQRLDYCEQFENFLSGDYTQWCRRAQDGAFDWIDSLRMAGISGEASAAPVAQAEEPVSGIDDAGETEAMLLQKLSAEADDDQDNAGKADIEVDELDITLKHAATVLQANHNAQPAPVEQSAIEANEVREIGENAAVETEMIETDAPLPPDESEQPDKFDDTGETARRTLCPDEEDTQQEEEPLVTMAAAKKHGAMRRLVAKLWGE